MDNMFIHIPKVIAELKTMRAANGQECWIMTPRVFKYLYDRKKPMRKKLLILARAWARRADS